MQNKICRLQPIDGILNKFLIQAYFCVLQEYACIKKIIMRIQFIFLFISFLLFPYASFTQASTKDSLAAIGKSFDERATAVFEVNLDSCFYYTQQASKYFLEAEAWENYVESLNNASFIRYYQGNYVEFEKYALLAMEKSAALLGENSKSYSTALGNYSVFLDNKGDYDEAMKLYRKKEQLQKKSKASKISQAILYHNMSNTFRNKGDYDEGIRYLNNSLRYYLDTVGVRSYQVASVHLALGHLYRDKKQLTQAIQYYHQFLTTAYLDKTAKNKILTRDLIYCYQSLARIFIKIENKDSTNHYLNLAMQLHPEVSAMRKIPSHEILGNHYLAQKQYSRAIKAFEKATDLAYEAYNNFNKHEVKSRSFRNLANAYLAINNFEKALENHQSALKNLALNFENSDPSVNPNIKQCISKVEALEIIEGKSKTYFKKYQQTKNLTDLKLAHKNALFGIEIINVLRRSFLDEGSKQVLAEKSLSIYELGIESTLALYDQNKDEKHLEAAFQFAEQSKAVILLESIQENIAIIGGDIPLIDQEKESAFRRDISFYENNINRAKRTPENLDVKKIQNWEKKLFRLQEDYNQLIALFEKDYPQYYDLKYQIKKLGIKEIRKRLLDQDNAIVEYFVGAETVFIFCITQTKFEVYQCPKNTTFDEQINALRQIISTPPFQKDILKESQSFAQLSFQLFKDILQPAIEDLSTNIQKLIIIPDGLLSYLPFETFVVERPSTELNDFSSNHFQYLISQYTISYNYSIGLLGMQKDKMIEPTDYSFIGFAPSFGDQKKTANRSCNNNKVYSLQCNKKEVESINHIFKGKVITGSSANRNAFQEDAANCQILHLATHACIDEEDPDQNKIYFSDDYLAGKELYNLDINAELAVLSACNTGSGKLVKGEGLMSLSRAFILSGCPSTLTTLWSVDDCITSQIMSSYYQHLHDGMPKDKALRESKLTHLKTADKIIAHPFFWAPFVQSGNTDVLNISPTFFLNTYLCLFLFFILIIIFWRLIFRK